MQIDRQTEAKVAIASIRQILDALLNRIETDDFTEIDLTYLNSLEQQAGRTSNWILLNSYNKPIVTFDIEAAERELWLLAAQRKPTTIGCVTID